MMIFFEISEFLRTGGSAMLALVRVQSPRASRPRSLILEWRSVVRNPYFKVVRSQR
jgi:hypothetical protein